VLAAKNSVGRAGRGDDDIGLVAGIVEILELDGLTVEPLRQSDGAFVGAIGDKDRSAAMRHQMPGREFAHLARPDDENVLALQRTENLLGQFHRDRSNGNRRRSHRSLAAHAFGDGKGASEELIELSSNRADGAGGCIGLFHLPQNLRFADHHRIQARSHTEDVPYRLFLAELIQMRIQFGGGKVKVVVQKAAQVRRAVAGVSDHFHAIAGGNNHALFHAGMRGEIAAAIRKLRFRNRQSLPHFERSALVIHADELISHEAANL